MFGSLPPEGRDLDLLARPAAEKAIADALGGQGLLRRGAQWALFGEDRAFGVELVPAESWGLLAAELEQLFAEATRLPGARRLVEPAPHHALLIAARKRGGRLDPKLRTRVARQLARDSGAWEAAEASAGRWRAERALARLRRAYERPVERAAARMRLGDLRRALATARSGHVISLSGLDGAGKSSQAESVAFGLGQLGIPAAVVWTPFASNRSLRLLAAPAKRLLGRKRGGDGEEPSLVARPGSDRAGGGALGGLVAHGWATVVAVTNGLAQRRASLPHLLRGRIVIFDRYSLDSAVHLRYLYGEARRFRCQNALIAALSPKPLRAYFLDVPPETVVARKPIQYELDHVRRQAGLYREEQERRGVKRLDGERPREELSAEILADVWSAL